MSDFERVGRRLRVELPDSLVRLWTSPPRLGLRLYKPNAPDRNSSSLGAALRSLQTSHHPVPPGLIPISYVDDRSLACVVCRPVDGDPNGIEGHVVRWHLDDIPETHQAAVLDVNAVQYAESLFEEYGRSWYAGYARMVEVAGRYNDRFVSKGRTPKAHDLRPFQLACQNVIIGLAAMRHDPIIDGLRVECWQTCEVPHVATNEGTRALTALMLCDAFQSGGTMEINFEMHPENRVPAALRRYGRTLGIELGAGEAGAHSISPAEARQLFLAVTPMPDGLRHAADDAMSRGMVSAERLCFSLLSPVWPAIELDFLLRCSNRAGSILRGGADIEDHESRLAEMELARAATMAGTVFRRLDRKDGAGGTRDNGSIRTFEDSSHGVTWRVIGECAAVEFQGVPNGPLPWPSFGTPQYEVTDGRLVVLPRPHPLAHDQDAMAGLVPGAPVLLVIPTGVTAPPDIPYMLCPDRLSEIDARVIRNLQTSELIRA